MVDNDLAGNRIALHVWVDGGTGELRGNTCTDNERDIVLAGWTAPDVTDNRCEVEKEAPVGPEPEPPISSTTTTLPPDSVLLVADGLAVASFGHSEEFAMGELTRLLGPPTDEFVDLSMGTWSPPRPILPETSTLRAVGWSENGLVVYFSDGVAWSDGRIGMRLVGWMCCWVDPFGPVQTPSAPAATPDGITLGTPLSRVEAIHSGGVDFAGLTGPMSLVAHYRLPASASILATPPLEPVHVLVLEREGRDEVVGLWAGVELG